MGRRMVIARQIAGLSQIEAAKALHYSQAVQLSLMEGGQRAPNLVTLMTLCRLYNTTMNFLCGFIEGSELDPVAAAQARVADRIAAEIRAVVRRVASVQPDAVLQRAAAAEASRLAHLVLDFGQALATFRAHCAEFDDLRGSAAVVARAETAVQRAQAVAAHAVQAQRAKASGAHHAHGPAWVDSDVTTAYPAASQARAA